MMRGSGKVMTERVVRTRSSVREVVEEAAATKAMKRESVVEGGV
jgi:hypothetical protein